MKLTMILGDFARVADGKLDVLGGGWNVTGPGPTNLGIGIITEVAWDELDAKHTLRVRLEDHEGHPVRNSDGSPALEFEGEMVTQRPPGVLLGLPVVNHLGVNIAGIQLPPGRHFRLQAAADGYENPDWCVTFSTRPAAA